MMQQLKFHAITIPSLYIFNLSRQCYYSECSLSLFLDIVALTLYTRPKYNVYGLCVHNTNCPRLKARYYQTAQIHETDIAKFFLLSY